MHVLHTFANNSSVPYLSWFAERAHREGGIKYSFLLLNTERPAMIDEMAQYGFNSHWMPYDPAHRKASMTKAFPWLWRHIRRIKPDIVHCNLFDDTVPGMLASRVAGAPIRVVTKQDTGYHWLNARKWVKMDRLVSRLATDIITISNESRQYLIDHEEVPARKLHLVHNGIPPERFTRQVPSTITALQARFRTEGRFPVVGTVARFVPWKGQELIVEAAKQIVKEHPNALFLLCGTGDDKDRISQLVHNAELDRHVIFTGWIERDDIPSFYGLLDVYMHAAKLEPFGLIYPEAMMNEVPVVSTRTGAALDAIDDGRNGILANEYSGQALAEGLSRLLEMDLKAVGTAGKETALRMFPFEVMWKGTTEVYHNALARSK